mmetsp:Transcript_13758/g.27208  ORF Transcript_13758/g.27208 Transcript_13758/m.27208 type:complete len:203 (-) Transcript_13758:1294-1902(-)
MVESSALPRSAVRSLSLRLCSTSLIDILPISASPAPAASSAGVVENADALDEGEGVSLTALLLSSASRGRTRGRSLASCLARASWPYDSPPSMSTPYLVSVWSMRARPTLRRSADVTIWARVRPSSSTADMASMGSSANSMRRLTLSQSQSCPAEISCAGSHSPMSPTPLSAMSDATSSLPACTAYSSAVRPLTSTSLLSPG